MAQPAKTPQRDLAEDIRLFRAELDAFIDSKVAELKKSYPNQPEPSLRMDLMRHCNCVCAVALEILGQK